MPAYVLIPQGVSSTDRLPAVITCHGHGYASREIVGLPPVNHNGGKSPTYQKNFAIELVKRGFLVIAPELFGFGDRRLGKDYDQNTNNSCRPISTLLLQLGQTMSGYRIYETMRVVDYLQTRSDVDHERIGCMGISGGGLVAAFTSALDERISAVVVSGYINTFKDSILAMDHCVDNYIPRLNLHAEMPDIVGLIAPRPLLVESGEDDSIFPLHAARAASDQIRKVYQLLGEEEKFAHDVFAGRHEINGVESYEWLIRWLCHNSMKKEGSENDR